MTLDLGGLSGLSGEDRALLAAALGLRLQVARANGEADAVRKIEALLRRLAGP